MQAFDYDEVLDMILAKDDRYHRDAYYFVREGLDFTQQKLTKAAGAKEPRHVSGAGVDGRDAPLCARELRADGQDAAQ